MNQERNLVWAKRLHWEKYLRPQSIPDHGWDHQGDSAEGCARIQPSEEYNEPSQRKRRIRK
jgi:hypothetical protein